MGLKKDLYSISEENLKSLASKYDIVDIAEGKGGLALRKIENRLKAVSYLAEKSDVVKLKLVYDVINHKGNSSYWKSIIKNEKRELDYGLIDNTKDTLTGYLKKYTSNSQPVEQEKIKDNKKPRELEGVVSSKSERSGLLSKIAGSAKTKIILGIAGLSLLAGVIGGGISYSLSERLSKKGPTTKAYITQLEQENSALKCKNKEYKKTVQKAICMKDWEIKRIERKMKESDKRIERYETALNPCKTEKNALTPKAVYPEIPAYKGPTHNGGNFPGANSNPGKNFVVPKEFDEKELKDRKEAKIVYDAFRRRAVRRFRRIPKAIGHSIGNIIKVPVDLAMTGERTIASIFAPNEEKRSERWQEKKAYWHDFQEDGFDALEGINDTLENSIRGSLDLVAASTPLGYKDIQIIPHKIDNLLYHFFDAVPGGYFDREVKSRLSRLRLTGKGSLVELTFDKENPENIFKVPLALWSDWRLIEEILGEINDKWLGGGNPSIDPVKQIPPGRTGGAPTLPGRGGGSAIPTVRGGMPGRL